MARVRWTRRARGEHRAATLWLADHRGPEGATRVAEEVAAAIGSAARNPQGYAWVGAIHATLEAVPPNVRRVLTRSRRHVVYYRYRSESDEVEVLAVRGAGQLPPSPDDLLA